MNEKIWPVGTIFKTRGKHPRECTVVDIWETRSLVNGERMRIRYVATHLGPLGQTVTDYDVVAPTIAMGLVKEGSGA